MTLQNSYGLTLDATALLDRTWGEGHNWKFRQLDEWLPVLREIARIEGRPAWNEGCRAR